MRRSLFIIIACVCLLLNQRGYTGKDTYQQKTEAFYNPQVEVTTLLKSHKSWDGVALPTYPQGQPQTTVLKITIPANMELPLHFHPVINTAMVFEGHLRITTSEGNSMEFRSGDVFNEVVGTRHFCKNLEDKPATLYVFYTNVVDGPPLTILANK